MPRISGALTFVLAAASVSLLAQSAAPSKTAPKAKSAAKTAAAAPAAPVLSDPGKSMLASEPPPPKATVVEEIVARVNNKIITTTDLQNAKSDLLQSLQDQAQKSGTPLTQTQIDTQEKDLLANLIDNQLLDQKASDLGMSAETETVLQLDQLRQQNHLASMEDLQKAIEGQGEGYEDFKQSITNQILQQKVIEEDVAPRVPQATPAQIAKFYNEHKSNFLRGDEVGLSEILIKTEGKTDAEKKRLKDLADQVQQRAAAGEDYAKLAQKYSNADTAAQGGDIGFQKKDQLEAKLAATLFSLPVGGVTPVEEVPNGYLILKVTAVHHAGQESLADASPEISYQLYQQMLRPELQTYLAKLRQDAYITVKPGYIDTGANASLSPDITHYQRVLPSDLPKPTDKDKKGSGFNMGGGGL
ncbi:MAG TPA: peptidyl-prolyl cis-trans isomerase [Terriglobales bacterium]|nr:peptidyl-prolyl cis-trans isomerase [Terriglobales bacterium]